MANTTSPGCIQETQFEVRLKVKCAQARCTKIVKWCNMKTQVSLILHIFHEKYWRAQGL